MKISHMKKDELFEGFYLIKSADLRQTRAGKLPSACLSLVNPMIQLISRSSRQLMSRKSVTICRK